MKRHVKAFLIVAAIAAALFYALLPTSQKHANTETFTVDNLVAQTSITDNGLTSSTLVFNNGSKVLTSYTGSACGAGSAMTGITTAGSAQCVAVATNGTPAVAVAVGSANYSGTINMTTQGTIDWIAPGTGANSSSLPIYQNQNGYTVATKATSDGSLYYTYQAYGTAVPSYNANTDGATTWTAAAGDSLSGIAVSTNKYFSRFTTSGNGGYGDRVVVPTGATQRVFRWYIDAQNCTVTVTATLTPSGVGSSANFVYDNSSPSRLFTITYTGGAGDHLVVTTLTSALVAPGCVLNDGPITIGTL